MKPVTRKLLAMASVAVSVGLAGCCVTSISCRKVCEPSCQNYESIPQGIEPVEAPPAVEPAPSPVPPSPSSAGRGFGIRTTSFLQSLGERMRNPLGR